MVHKGVAISEVVALLEEVPSDQDVARTISAYMIPCFTLMIME